MSILQAGAWTQIEHLLDAGVSLIPIWDEDKQNGKGKKKAACIEWTEYQSKIITKENLFFSMEQANTSAVAMVCGAVSGNLEVIDIDVKYRPGIDADLFIAIQTLYPDLYARLRIHKTPSGGFHLLYRVEGMALPGNKKLARRPATDAELKLNQKTKAYAFIETRGEGGYVAAPPSLGYAVLKEVPIPTITSQERNSLWAICTQFNLLIKEEQPYKPPQQESDYYDENPFEDFNRRAEPVQTLEQFGFKYVKTSGSYIWFTRPGGKKDDVHASFNLQKRFYYIFSTNTELESDRAYMPSTILRLLQFQGDGKKLHAHLVQQGYGRIKQHVEKRLVKAQALRGQPLPPNASAEAQTEYITTKAQLDEQHPYGVFWFPRDSGGYRIDRERLYTVAEGLGFRVWQDQPVRIQTYTVSRQTERDFFDTLKAYIREDDYEAYNDICGTYEAFLQKSGSFSISRLPLLNEALVLSDTRLAAYKFYENGFLTITINQLTFYPWDQLPAGKLVWADRVQPRPYDAKAPAECLYTKFLAKAISNDEDHLQAILGYLAHQYKDETLGYIIVLTEEAEDPKQGGGTGKNIFSALLAHTTTWRSMPGVLVKQDEKFLQAWDYERILSISDVPKKFDFEFLKEFSTGAGKVKKLFHDEQTIPCELMPKFIVSTQFSYEVSDGGLRRRLIPLEFTGFFTKAGGVDVYFKQKHFPRDWSQADWAGYDAYIAVCIQTWLRGGLKLQIPDLSVTGKTKQFDMSYGQMLRQFFDEHWEYWAEENKIEINKFRQAYDQFCNENDIGKQFHVSPQRMNSALAEYCSEKNFTFDANFQWFESGIKFKGKFFGPPAPF